MERLEVDGSVGLLTRIVEPLEPEMMKSYTQTIAL